MSDFRSRSQVGQDIFAWVASGKKLDGTFLDIGSSNAVDRNNSIALEGIGWTGNLVDISYLAEVTAAQSRKSKFHKVDATTANWREILGNVSWVDYLSLDVDEVTYRALCGLPYASIRFGAITIEHDAYRWGDVQRYGMRALLGELGYIMVASDVKDQDLEFEDWWVDQRFASNASVFASKSLDWKDVVGRVEL